MRKLTLLLILTFASTSLVGQVQKLSVESAIDISKKLIPEAAKLDAISIKGKVAPVYDFALQFGPTEDGAQARFSCFVDGRIESYRASGNWVNTKKLEDIRRVADEHPTLSDDAIVEMLQKAGAKFGPQNKKELQAIFPITALEKLAGPL